MTDHVTSLGAPNRKGHYKTAGQRTEGMTFRMATKEFTVESNLND